MNWFIVSAGKPCCVHIMHSGNNVGTCSRCAVVTNPSSSRGTIRIASTPRSYESVCGYRCTGHMKSYCATHSSEMLPCRSKVPTIGISGPTTSRIIIARFPSMSS